MNSQLLYKRFTLRLLISTVAILVILSAINLIVDPFGIYNVFISSGFNKIKPDMYKKARMSKAHSVYRMNPDMIIAGTSRSEWGLKVNSPILKESAFRTYNLSLPGARIDESYKYIKFANRNGSVKDVILGLDFFSFNGNKKDKPDFSDERLNSTWSLWIESLTLLVSVDTLVSSIQTLKGQKYSGNLQFDRNGQIDDRSISANFERSTPYDHLWSGVLSFLKRYLPNAEAKFSFSMGSLNTLETFKDILSYCRERRINLHPFISPIHAIRLETIRELGLWHKYEYWKRSLVRILEEERRVSPENRVILYDFSGYNEFTTEDIPSPKNRNHKMNYFWNDNHYKSELGDIILGKIFSKIEKADESIPNGFGIILDINSLEEHLLETRKKQAEFGAQHASALFQINKLKSLLNSNKLVFK